MSMIEGVEDRFLRGGERRRNIKGGEEEKISKGKVRQAIRRLRDRKIMDQDRISRERKCVKLLNQ